MKNIFTAHPKRVNETYFQHLKFASCFAAQLFIAAAAGMIHAFLPFLFENIASNILYRLVQKMKDTGRWKEGKETTG